MFIGNIFLMRERNINMDEITFKVLRDGSQLWFKNGKHGRKDGPSEIYINGIQFWYKNGVLQ